MTANCCCCCCYCCCCRGTTRSVREDSHNFILLSFSKALSSGCKTKKQERKAAEVRELGIYHELMGNDDGIVHLLHTPAAARNMEDNRREKKEVRKERKIETDRTKWVHLLEHQAFLSFVFFFSDKSLLAAAPNTSSTAAAAAALAAEETLLSHSPSLSLSLSLSQIHVHTYIHTFILSRMCIKYSLSLTCIHTCMHIRIYTYMHISAHTCFEKRIHTLTHRFFL